MVRRPGVAHIPTRRARWWGDARPRGSSRPVAVMAGRAVTVALIAVLVSSCSIWPKPDDSGGPIGNDAHAGWIGTFNVGDAFTSGFLVLENLGDTPLTIVSLTPNLRGGGLEYLGAYALDDDRRYAYFDGKLGWPRSYRGDKLHPLGDVPLLPKVAMANDRYQVGAYLMGYRVVSEGKTEVTSVSVTYTDGVTTWSENILLAFTICTPDGVKCRESRDL